MANIIVLDDCIDATTKVWFDHYRGTPRWTTHYRGPALKTGMHDICKTSIPEHDSGCSGSAWVITETQEHSLAYQAQFDVLCGGPGLIEPIPPERQAYGHSEYLANLVFRVDGSGGSVRFSGTTHEEVENVTRMCLYDWTTGETMTTDFGENIDLIDSHIYRMTAYVMMRGFNDPTEIYIGLYFDEGASITITEQPVVCCPLLECSDDVQQSPQPPVLGTG